MRLNALISDSLPAVARHAGPGRCCLPADLYLAASL